MSRGQTIILASSIAAAGLLAVCLCGAGITIAMKWSAPKSASALATPIGAVTLAEKNARSPAQEPDLMLVFQHSPKVSVGKLVKENSPIPPGWEGGGGRILSPEYARRELDIAATLTDGKEGDTASVERLGR